MPERLAGLEVIRPPYFARRTPSAPPLRKPAARSTASIPSRASRARRRSPRRKPKRAHRRPASGALEESIVVTEREDVPLAYLRGNATRVRVKVVGDLKF